VTETRQGRTGSTEERLFAVLHEVLGVPRDALAAAARLDEVAPLDSLSLAELASAIDEEFDIQLPGEELTTSLAIGELASIVDAARAGGG
jgi:acyl carrier protein